MKRSLIIVLLLVMALHACKSKKKIVDAKIENKVSKNKLEFDLLPYLSNNKLEEVEIGDLFLPSGKIVAGDPFFINEKLPFSKTIKPGKYPVKILISKIEEDHYRIAYAKISFSSTKAVRWEMALTSSITQNEIDSIEAGEFFGYPVDAGLGCFTDAESNKLFNEVFDEFYKTHPNGNYYSDVLAPEFKKMSGNHRFSREDGDWCNHFLKATEHNVVIFSSGWGDGFFPTYWGYDIKGELVELITDFLVLNPESNEVIK